MLDYILKTLESVPINQNYIVGIDGGTGAGKTTLVQNISSSLQSAGRNVVVLHVDDFIHPRSIRYNDLYEEWYCYYNLQWRYDYLVETVLESAKNNQGINKQIELYDKETDEYALKNISIAPGSILIIEGVFLQRDELRDYFDLMFFIDVDKRIRLNRVLNRDAYIGDKEQIRKKYETRYFLAEDYYTQEHRPKENADIILCNEE